MIDTLLLTETDLGEIRHRIEKYQWAKDLYQKIESSRAFYELDMNLVTDGHTLTDHMWREGVLLRERSLLYAISGDDKDVEKIVEILEERFFGDWKLKNCGFINVLAVPLDFESQVNYWMFWLYFANHIFALSLIKNHSIFDRKTLERFERRCHEILEAKKKNYFETAELTNTRYWDVTGLGVMGVFLEDPEAVNLAVNGRYGFKYMLNRFYDELFWCEATVYGFDYVCNCSIMLAEACRKNGYEDLFKYTAPSGGSIKAMFDGWIKLMFADGRVGTHGNGGQHSQIFYRKYGETTRHEFDAYLFNRPGINEYNKVEIAYNRYKDPVYVWILSQNPSRDFYDTHYWGHAALTHGVALGETRPPDAMSSVFKEYGLAMVRSDETESYWNSDSVAILARDGTRTGHSHRDHFSFVLNAFKKNIYPDWYINWDYRGAVDPKTGKQRLTKGYSGSMLGHNTVMVDGKDAELYQGQVLHVDRKGAMKILRIMSVRDGGAYKGVFHTRILGITKQYVLDVFEIRSAYWGGKYTGTFIQNPHTYDYLLHSFGSLSVNGVANLTGHNLDDLRDEWEIWEIDSSATTAGNLWIRPGSRGVAEGDWRARFEDADGIGCNVFMLAEAGTEVILTDTPYEVSSHGWDTKSDTVDRKMPLLVVRRNTAYTAFVAVHQPFKHEAPPLEVSREKDIVTIQGDGFRDLFDLETSDFRRELE